MSHRVLSPQQFFHGSRHSFKPGDLLTPEGGAKAGSSWGAGQTDMHVYFTPERHKAAAFAEGGYGPSHDIDAPPRVYHVEPTGPHETDEMEEFPSFKTRHPVRVLGEVPYEA